MKMYKYLIYISVFSIISTMGYSKGDLTSDKFKNLNFEYDKSYMSIFDYVLWEKINEKNGIIFYMQKNKKERINFYKAEKKINSDHGEKFFKKLMNFDGYSKIFPRTLIYKKIKDISENKFLIYCQINFKPFKNRDYYLILEYSIENKDNMKEWTIEWYPLGFLPEKFPDEKGFMRVIEIYGRWKILENNNDIKISIEFYNNFNFNFEKSITVPIEKNTIIETLNQIINSINK